MSADLQYTLGLDGSQFGRTVAAVQNEAARLRSTLIGLGAGFLSGAILKEGLQFNQAMRDSEAAIAKVVQQFQHLDTAAAKAVATKAMQQIVELEPKAAGSLQDLTSGFLATLAASQAAGLSVEQNIDLVGRFANAMANANIPAEQLKQEMGSIMMGNITQDSALAKTLNITNEMVEAARKSGSLYGFLVNKIGMLGEAGDTAAVAFSSLKSAVDKVAGELTAGLFDQTVEGSKTLTAYLNENIDAFKRLGEALTGAGSLLGDVFSGIGGAVEQAAEVLTIIRLVKDEGMAAGDAARLVNELRDARLGAAEAAKEEARAAEEKKQAMVDELQAAAKARADAAAATAKAGLSKPGDADVTPKKSGKNTFDEQERLDQAKREAAREEMTTAQKIAATRQEILGIEEEIAALKSDPFGQNQGKILDAETRKVALARELAALQKEAAHDAETAAKKAEDQARQQRENAQQMARGRNELMGELAVLEEQAKGHHRKADAIKRQLDIERDKFEIMKATGASEEEALRLATRRADLKDKINKGETGGRSHIGGVGRRRAMGGHLSDFTDLQRRESSFDRLQRGKTESLSGRFTRMSGSISRVSRLMGKTDTRPLSDRARSLVTPPVKPEPGDTKPAEDPILAELRAVRGELNRIRTA